MTGQPTERDLVQIMVWLNIPRMIVPTAVFILILLLARSGAVSFDPRPVLYGLLPAVLVLSLLWSYLAVRNIASRPLILAQLILDVVAVSIGIYLTGGLNSQFVFIYLLVIVSASLVSLGATLLVGGLSVAAYVGLLLGEYSGLLAMSPPSSGREDIIRATILVLLIGLIGFQSNFYLRQIRKRDAEVLKLKDEFLFRTIHDLRSPSTVLRLILDKYREEDYVRQFPEIAADIGLLKKVNARMSGLVEELLKVSRGETSEVVFKKEPLDLAALLRGCLDELRPQLAERRISANYVSADVPPLIGDGEKLKEVFNNFLSNAVKYNKEGGTIELTHERDGRSLVTIIKDSGIGIKPENLAKMFTPYFRGDVDRSIQGTGLGLYYTKKLIDKMGGRVEIDSEAGRGTTFRVFLPIG